MMLSIPIGTLIGILLLIALVQGAPLFGPGRIPHRAIDAEWKLRKQRRKAGA